MQKGPAQLRDPPVGPSASSENSVEKCYNLGPKSQIPLRNPKFLNSGMLLPPPCSLLSLPLHLLLILKFSHTQKANIVLWSFI